MVIDTKRELIQQILQVVKANNVPISADLLFMLAYRTESELREICHDLHIQVTR